MCPLRGPTSSATRARAGTSTQSPHEEFRPRSAGMRVVGSRSGCTRQELLAIPARLGRPAERAPLRAPDRTGVGPATARASLSRSSVGGGRRRAARALAADRDAADGACRAAAAVAAPRPPYIRKYGFLRAQRRSRSCAAELPAVSTSRGLSGGRMTPSSQRPALASRLTLSRTAKESPPCSRRRLRGQHPRGRPSSSPSGPALTPMTRAMRAWATPQ